MKPTCMRAALQEIDEGDGRGSSTDRPAGAASRVHDVWGICGDTLIRYHFKTRNEVFSPDLTDWPFDLSRISSSRYTKIIPYGGDSIMDDEDDWRNVRRRNKKLRFKWIGQTGCQSKNTFFNQKFFFQSKKTSIKKTFPLSYKKRREYGRKDGRKEGRQGGRKEGRK